MSLSLTAIIWNLCLVVWSSPMGSLQLTILKTSLSSRRSLMEVVSEIREENMFTYPVLTYSLYYKDGKFQDEEFARWCSNHNIKWSDSNFFVSDNIGILSTAAGCSATPRSWMRLLTLSAVQPSVLVRVASAPLTLSALRMRAR